MCGGSNGKSEPEEASDQLPLPEYREADSQTARGSAATVSGVGLHPVGDYAEVPADRERDVQRGADEAMDAVERREG